MEDEQTNINEITTEIVEDVQTQTNNIEDTTKLTFDVQTDNFDSTTKINEDDITINLDSTTNIIEDVQTNDMKVTTSVMESTAPKRPQHKSPNRNILTEVAIEDDQVLSDINEENAQRQRNVNNSLDDNSSEEMLFSTLVDQQAQLSTDTIPHLLNDEKQSTTLAVEEEQSDAAQDTTPNLSKQDDKQSSIKPVTTNMISRILGGPKKFDDDKFSQISNSFKIFLKDFVDIISSDVKEKLSREKSTVQFIASDKNSAAPNQKNDLGNENGYVYDGGDYSYGYDGTDYQRLGEIGSGSETVQHFSTPNR